MAHIKIVSFTPRGAASGLQIAGQLDGALIERYRFGEDASLAASSLSRFVQQAMVDCDMIIFISDVPAAVCAVAPYIANNGYDPAVLCVDQSLQSIVQLLKGRYDISETITGKLSDSLNIPLIK